MYIDHFQVNRVLLPLAFFNSARGYKKQANT